MSPGSVNPTFIYCNQQLYICSCKHLFLISVDHAHVQTMRWAPTWSSGSSFRTLRISLNTEITCEYYCKRGGNWATTPTLSYLRWQLSCHPYSFLPYVATELPPLLFRTLGGNWATTLTLSYLTVTWGQHFPSDQCFKSVYGFLMTYLYKSRDMRFPTMWYMYMRPAKPEISMRLRAVWSKPLLVAWIFYEF